MKNIKSEFEYKSECVCPENRRVKAYFRYPIGEPFGDFYSEIAERCRGFVEREYSGYSGRGLTYRFFASVIYSQNGVTSVTLDFSLNEKNGGKIKEQFFAQNWLDDGRILPLFALRDKKLTAKKLSHACGYYILDGEIFLFDEAGQKFASGVKNGNLCQKILPNNLKNLR